MPACTFCVHRDVLPNTAPCFICHQDPDHPSFERRPPEEKQKLKQIDLIKAVDVELVADKGGVWVNVDGICVLRVKKAMNIRTTFR